MCPFLSVFILYLVLSFVAWAAVVQKVENGELALDTLWGLILAHTQ